MNNSPFSSENTPSPNPTSELAPNQISGERVLQPPAQSEMLSEPKVGEPKTTPFASTQTPSATPAVSAKPVASASPESAKDYRPAYAQGVPMRDPAADILPKYKTGLPDGIYFLAGIMFVPLLTTLQALYIGLDYQSTSSSSIISAQLSSLFRDFPASLSSIATLTMGISAILLIFTRFKITRFVAIIGLGLYIIAQLIPYFQSAGEISLLFNGSKIGHVLLVDALVLSFVLPILGIIYLCRPSVRASYDN